MAANQPKAFFGPTSSFVLKVALIHFALFNLPVIYAMPDLVGQDILGQIGSKNVLFYSVTLGVLYFFATSLLIGFLIINRVIFWLLTPALFFLSSILTYFVYVYKIAFAPSTMHVVFHNDVGESADLISGPLVLWILFCTCVSFWVIRLYNRAHIRVSRAYICCFILIFPTFIIFAGENFGIPLNFLAATYTYLNEKTFSPKRDNFVVQHFSDNPAVADDLTVVWVIGEAARRDHWHLNGYDRDTTPFVDKIPDVVNFTQARSCANSTDLSVSCLLTGASPQDMSPITTSGSFLGIFKKLGFPVYWVSNNSSIRELNTLIKQIISSAHEIDKIYDASPTDAQHMLASEVLYMIATEMKPKKEYGTPDEVDENMFPTIDRILKENPKKLFLVVHLNGSHWQYAHHYPKAFEKYRPVCTEASYFQCPKDSIINAYDNTILYTDYMLGQIIDRLKSRKAVLWYASDHGELLGERGLWNHMNPDRGPEQYIIPMIWWGSNQFIEQNPEIYAALKKHENQPVSHTNMFPSALDCASITPIPINKDLSLCH